MVDRCLLKINLDSVPIGLRSQGFFPLDAEQTNEEIEAFTSKKCGHLLGELRDDLFIFQRLITDSVSPTFPGSKTIWANSTRGKKQGFGKATVTRVARQ